MSKIVVAGAAGRMGRMIISAARGHDNCSITGAFERPDSPAVGQDAGILAGIGEIGVSVTDDAASALEGADVMIDFTIPEAAAEHAVMCAEAGIGMVIGTTGLDPDQKEVITESSLRVPVVFSPNMSVGVNLTFKVIEEVARILGWDYDVEIVEAHHRMKKDAPSGTAVRMLEILSEIRDLEKDKTAVYGRRGMVGPRPSEEIGVHAVRGGDIVGDHTVIFAGPGERIEIVHRAQSRETFARGAVRAALWVSGKEPGMYDMADVLGLKKSGIA